MRRIGDIFLLVAVVLLISSCASIVSKSEWPVKVASVPQGADFVITDLSSGEKVHSGKTPATMTLSSKGGFFKGRSYKVEITQDGYGTKTTEIKSTVNDWYIGNVIFGGLIGLLIVDPATGAMWTLEPKDINISLDKKLAGAQDDQAHLSIVSMEEVPDNAKNKLVRLQ